MKTKYLLIAVWAWGLVFAGAFLAAAVAKDVPRMTKEQLKEMLGSENVVVIDVRTGKDWKASDVSCTAPDPTKGLLPVRQKK